MKIVLILLGFVASNPLAYAAVGLMERLRQRLLGLPRPAIDWYRRFYGLSLGDATIRRIHTVAMVHKLFYYLDLFGYAAMRRKTLLKRLTMLGIEHFEQFKHSDRPIIFLQMHSGSFYSLLVWLTYEWKPINAVFVTQSPLRQAVHEATLAPYLLHQFTTYHAVVAGLRRGESCLIMFDGGRFNPKHAERLAINGCDLYFPTSCLAMARETACHILPVYSERRSWCETVFHFGPPIEATHDCSMARVFKWYLPFLRADPTQWFALIENLEAGARIRAQRDKDGSASNFVVGQ